MIRGFFTHFAAAVVTVLSTNAVQAAPIWEVDARWTCALERHMRLPVGGDVIEMDPVGKSYVIDFYRNTVTSAFIETVGKITHRYHHASPYGTHHILVVDWGEGGYPLTIIEELGTYFEFASSGRGSDNGDVWMALYTCQPGA